MVPNKSLNSSKLDFEPTPIESDHIELSEDFFCSLTQLVKVQFLKKNYICSMKLLGIFKSNYSTNHINSVG